MKEFQVKNHEPSLLPDGEFTLIWSDEFDGDKLDTAKWDYRTCMMGKQHPAWVRDGVTPDGKSNAVFTPMEQDGRLVSSQLQTGYNFMDEPVVPTMFGTSYLQWPVGKLHESKFLHSYGYYECRCRLQQKAGWWTAFWIQSPIIGASLDAKYTGAELDIMEFFTPRKINRHNVFAGGYGLDMMRHGCGGLNLDQTEFHRFGLLWEESGYTFYIDGVKDGKITENVSACPEFILISTEVRGYRHKDHQPVPEAYDAVGDTFLVDYVRVFDRK